MIPAITLRLVQARNAELHRQAAADRFARSVARVARHRAPSAPAARTPAAIPSRAA